MTTSTDPESGAVSDPVDRRETDGGAAGAPAQMPVSDRSDGRQDVIAVAKGTGFLAGGSFFEFGSRFLIAFLLARLIGADGYGLYNLALSAAAIFAGISALGLDDAMVRYVAIMSRRKDEAGLWGTLQIGVGVSTLFGIVMGAVLYLAAGPIAEGLFDEPRLTPLLELLAIVVPFLTLSTVLAGCSRGFGRMDYSAFSENVVQSLVRIVLLAGLALVGIDVRLAVIVYGISDVAATVTLIVLLNRQFKLRRPVFRGVRRDFKQIFSFAIPLWLSGVLSQFRKNLEALVLGALSTVSTVGVYSIVSRLNLLGHTAYRSIIISVKPVLARLHDQGDREGLGRIYTTATRWTLALNLPFFLVMVLYAEPLLRIFGDGFTAGATALIILSVAELVIAGTGVCGSVIDMAGHTAVKLANSVGWTVLLLVGNLLLVPRWGLVGAATASFIATAAVNIARLLEVWILERVQPYRREYWKPVVASAAAFGVGLAMRGVFPVDASLAAAALQGAVVMGVYAGLTVLFGLTEDDRLVLGRLLSRASGLFGRRRASSMT